MYSNVNKLESQPNFTDQRPNIWCSQWKPWNADGEQQLFIISTFQRYKYFIIL